MDEKSKSNEALLARIRRYAEIFQDDFWQYCEIPTNILTNYVEAIYFILREDGTSAVVPAIWYQEASSFSDTPAEWKLRTRIGGVTIHNEHQLNGLLVGKGEGGITWRKLTLREVPYNRTEQGFDLPPPTANRCEIDDFVSLFEEKLLIAKQEDPILALLLQNPE